MAVVAIRMATIATVLVSFGLLGTLPATSPMAESLLSSKGAPNCSCKAKTRCEAKGSEVCAPEVKTVLTRAVSKPAYAKDPRQFAYVRRKAEVWPKCCGIEPKILPQ